MEFARSYDQADASMKNKCQASKVLSRGTQAGYTPREANKEYLAINDINMVIEIKEFSDHNCCNLEAGPIRI